MSLYTDLQNVKSEEDVKDLYIRALNLKGYSRNLIDIQTKEVWFEAKGHARTSTYAMFTQLLHYVQVALNKDEYVPPLLCVIDTQKAAIMRSDEVIPFLKKKTIKWGTSASSYTQEALDTISTYIGTHFVSFKIETHENEFIETLKSAIKTGIISRTSITPENLRQVFDKWISLIGCEISGIKDEEYALLFYADIMHDGTYATHENLPAQLLHQNNAPVFLLNGKPYQLNSHEGYRQFWAIYQKPPKAEYRDELLARIDKLIPLNERMFKGAYYTPLPVVDKAYETLERALGKEWQKEYIVWDMCCGVGNLEVKHNYHRKVFMSTLDSADIDIMKATKTCVAAIRFQYDYLNDDITEFGEIDYTLTRKMPNELQQAIREKKKILVLINPPYAEATNFGNIAVGLEAENKKQVAKTKFAARSMNKYGKATNELFTQFVARIAKEIPNAKLAMFSTLKYVSAPNFEDFRNEWKAKFLDGFVVPSKVFDGLKGKFPIGFIVWDTGKKEKISEISATVLNDKCIPIGEKIFYNLPKDTFLNVWLKRPRANKVPALPLINAVTPVPVDGKPRVTTWANDAIAYMYCGVNDLQHAEQQTIIYSSVYQGGNGFYITPENLWQAAVIFSVRRIIKPTWLNDRDQFLQPNSELSDEFKLDCLILMLFNRCNRTASANGIEWNGKLWNLVSHFIPFTESEVGAPGRFESDFMVQYLADKVLSIEAQSLLDEGRNLWKSYFSKKDMRNIREEYKLNRDDVGWYQVRKAIEERNKDLNGVQASFDAFNNAYSQLEEKLRPQVYRYGFMK